MQPTKKISPSHSLPRFGFQICSLFNQKKKNKKKLRLSGLVSCRQEFTTRILGFLQPESRQSAKNIQTENYAIKRVPTYLLRERRFY